jgi:hypothetical protein
MNATWVQLAQHSLTDDSYLETGLPDRRTPQCSEYPERSVLTSVLGAPPDSEPRAYLAAGNPVTSHESSVTEYWANDERRR